MARPTCGEEDVAEAGDEQGDLHARLLAVEPRRTVLDCADDELGLEDDVLVLVLAAVVAPRRASSSAAVRPS